MLNTAWHRWRWDLTDDARRRRARRYRQEEHLTWLRMVRWMQNWRWTSLQATQHNKRGQDALLHMRADKVARAWLYWGLATRIQEALRVAAGQWRARAVWLAWGYWRLDTSSKIFDELKLLRMQRKMRCYKYRIVWRELQALVSQERGWDKVLQRSLRHCDIESLQRGWQKLCWAYHSGLIAARGLHCLLGRLIWKALQRWMMIARWLRERQMREQQAMICWTYCTLAEGAMALEAWRRAVVWSETQQFFRVRAEESFRHTRQLSVLHHWRSAASSLRRSSRWLRCGIRSVHQSSMHEAFEIWREAMAWEHWAAQKMHRVRIAVVRRQMMNSIRFWEKHVAALRGKKKKQRGARRRAFEHFAAGRAGDQRLRALEPTSHTELQLATPHQRSVATSRDAKKSKPKPKPKVTNHFASSNEMGNFRRWSTLQAKQTPVLELKPQQSLTSREHSQHTNTTGQGLKSILLQIAQEL